MSQISLLSAYAVRKDAEAFATIVNQYQRLVFATCRRKLRNTADTEDAVQETFLRLAQRAADVRSNLGGWLHTCAVNVSIDMNRRRATRQRHETASVQQIDPTDDAQRILAELRAHLDEALGRLDADSRELIIQRYFAGRTQADLAAEANVVPSTITHRMDRAIELLREHLRTMGCAAAAGGAATLAAGLGAEHASAAVSQALTANLMKIGLSGMDGAAAGASVHGSTIFKLFIAFAAILVVGFGFWLWSTIQSSSGEQGLSADRNSPSGQTVGGKISSPGGIPIVGSPDDTMGFNAQDWDKTARGAYVTAMAAADGKGYVATEDHGMWMRDGAQWTAFGPTGVVGDTARSIAIDRLHRVWVGHGRHGVSVFNGTEWKNYDAPEGPLGHRIYRIVISPIDGDVWLATELGLTRYSIAADRWSHITRQNGLPADQINAIAFDSKGTLYVATQCDGLAIGSPSDQYATWRVVNGPDREPVEKTGEGLPSNMVNDVLVNSTGTVFVGTCVGLAVSRDNAASWTFYRGGDFTDKVKNRTGGLPKGWSEPTDPFVLSEDFITCLTEGRDGKIWIGHRQTGYEVLDPKSLARLAGTHETKGMPDYVQCIAEASPNWIWIGGFGAGPFTRPVDTGNAPGAQDMPALPVANNTIAPASALPTPFSVSPEECLAMLKELDGVKHQPLNAAFIGDDWVTQGDGVGRYGQQKMSFPAGSMGGGALGYQLSVAIGPHSTRGGPFTYSIGESDERIPYLPNAFKRRVGEWNDGSFTKTVWAQEGPDLWLRVTVPAGVQRMTLLFMNYDSHNTRRDRVRDLFVEVKEAGQGIAPPDSTPSDDPQHLQESVTTGAGDDIAAADFAPSIAKARAQDFYDPVYKQFLLAGGKSYLVKISRDHGFEAKLSGVFFDRMRGDAASNLDSLPSPLLDENHWGPPGISTSPADESRPVVTAQQLWSEMDAHYDDAGFAPLQLEMRLLAFRLAEQSGADPTLLANWRWKLGLWNDADRLEFCREMDAGYEKIAKNNPQMANKPRDSMVDLYFKTHPAQAVDATQPSNP